MSDLDRAMGWLSEVRGMHRGGIQLDHESALHGLDLIETAMDQLRAERDEARTLASAQRDCRSSARWPFLASPAHTYIRVSGPCWRLCVSAVSERSDCCC